MTDQAEDGPRSERRRGRGRRNAEGRPQGPGPFGKDGRHGHGPFGGKGHGPRGGPGFGRPGGWQQADLLPADDAAAWFVGRLPEGFYVSAPSVSVDREEIIVIGEITAPALPAGADEASTESAVAGRIARFREETREQRIALATEAQARYGRTVAWGARIGDTQTHFSNAAVPVMTRLRQPERQVLDTLVTVETAIHLVDDGGRVVLVGIAPAGVAAGLDVAHVVRRKIQILGSYGARARTDMPTVLSLVASGAIDVKALITDRFSLEQASEAYDLLSAGEIVGRAVIDI